MNQNNILTIPTAIVIAGIIIAGAVLYQKGAFEPKKDGGNVTVERSIPPVTAEDHLLGNPNAIVKIIEYSDFECPWCQRFHPTMKQIMTEYGGKGQVAWVYRHFWTERKDESGKIFHPRGGPAAEASECVAELGGSSAFWKFADSIFERDWPKSLDKLNSLAGETGVDAKKFEECLSSGKYKNKVYVEEWAKAVSAGVKATPYNYVVGPDGKYILIAGAESYATVKQAVDTILANFKK